MYKLSRTEYKKLAHFLNGVSILWEFFLERGANLESRVAHTHPRNTQVPPPRDWRYDETNSMK